MGTAAFTSGLLEVGEDEDLVEYCYARGWTDGLPVVAPTPARVRAALDACGRDGDEVLIDYVDRSRTVRVEHVAVNAVMAGCRPDYLPVVLALVEAMGDPAFYLHAANASTGGMALGFVVNGPVRHRLAMNCQGNVLGPGNRANSTIGRALRLTQINAMGSVPGAGHDDVGPGGRAVLDRSTVGQPAKYAGYHLPEFEEAFSSLEPLHVLHGFGRDEDVVTLFDVVGHLQIPARGERTAAETVDTLCRYLVGSGRLRPFGHCVLVLPPENCETFVRDGWTKRDIAQAVYEGTRRTVAWVKRQGGIVNAGPMDRATAPPTAQDEHTEVAIAASPDDIHVVVAGGPAGAFMYALLPYAGGLAVRRVRDPGAGSPSPSPPTEPSKEQP